MSGRPKKKRGEKRKKKNVLNIFGNQLEGRNTQSLKPKSNKKGRKGSLGKRASMPNAREKEGNSSRRGENRRPEKKKAQWAPLFPPYRKRGGGGGCCSHIFAGKRKKRGKDEKGKGERFISEERKRKKNRFWF